MKTPAAQLLELRFLGELRGFSRLAGGSVDDGKVSPGPKKEEENQNKDNHKWRCDSSYAHHLRDGEHGHTHPDGKDNERKNRGRSERWRRRFLRFGAALRASLRHCLHTLDCWNGHHGHSSH